MGGPVVRFFVVVGEPCFSAAMICSLPRDWQPCTGSAHGLIQGCQACSAHPGENSVVCTSGLSALRCHTSLLLKWLPWVCHSNGYRCMVIWSTVRCRLTYCGFWKPGMRPTHAPLQNAAHSCTRPCIRDRNRAQKSSLQKEVTQCRDKCA